MARRSARLQKKPSPEPTSSSRSSRSSWETAQSNATPQPEERLPSVIEATEPVKTPQKTPQKAIARPMAVPQSATQLPQLSSTMTPSKSQSSMSKLADWAARTTPKNRTPIKAPSTEMHPAHHHASTAKVLDEARWLGFQSMGAQTAPSKATYAGIGPGTPSKTPIPTSTSRMANFLASPDFRFRFRSPVGDLTPKSSRILEEVLKEDADAGGRAIFAADEFSAPADVSAQRKTAQPKGKMARFSDVHMAQFKKMDSIANHPSAFRAAANRFKPADASPKRSPPKAGLDKAESSAKTPNKLKRTQSKMDMAGSASKATEPVMGLNRTQSNTDVAGAATKIIPPTPLKRTQSKMDMAPPISNLPRFHSTVRLVPPTRDGSRPTSQDGPSAKRFKRIETDDAASTRPVSREGLAQTATQTGASATPRRTLQSQIGLPRLASRLMTPTRSSLARSQSVKTLKSTSMLPSLVQSPSTHTLARAPPTLSLFSPTSIGQSMKDGMRQGIRKTSDSLHKVRSILRTPGRKYSDDPEQIAAGTHMSPPPGLDLSKALPKAPSTAPARKHVNFSTSTLERISHDELGKSPSPMKLRAGSEVPTGAVIYPKLQTGAEYPALPNGDESTSPSRRLTFGGATSNIPGQFLFTSDNPITFAPAAPGSIRVVRKSDASSLFDGNKRKLSTMEETSDKENNRPIPEDDGRAAKKMRTAPVESPKTPKSVSKLPRRTPNRGSAISKSRLAFLSTPKRGKA